MPRPSRQTMVALIVACALFMQNMDSTVIATALPTISAALGEDVLKLNLAITCYLLSLAIFIPLSGWTADRYGARTVFRAAVAVFTLGSVLCGIAGSLWALVLARIVQGAGGAMMVPVGRLVLLRTVPKAELVSAMSYLAVPALLGPVMGPPLGGLIVTYSSWRWIFFVNVPFGLLGILLINIFIENIRESAPGPLDLRGFLLAGLGLAGTVYGLAALGRGGLSLGIALPLIGSGAALLVLYAFHARLTPSPVIDLSLMRIQTFRAALVGSAVFRIGIDGLPFLMPVLLQLGFGLSPLSSGLLTFATYAGAMTMKTTATPIIRAFGFRQILMTNAVVCAAFMMSYGLFRPATPHVLIFAALLAGGFFRSLQVTGTNTLVFADVPAAQMSRATSFVSMAQQLAISLGIGFSAAMLHIVHVLRGGEALAVADFTPIFVANGCIALAAILSFVPLPGSAGAELSGHRVLAASPPQPPVR